MTQVIKDTSMLEREIIRVLSTGQKLTLKEICTHVDNAPQGGVRAILEMMAADGRAIIESVFGDGFSAMCWRLR